MPDYKGKFATPKTHWKLTKFVYPHDIAAELGIANVVLSDLILKRSNLDNFYSIDMYDDRKHTVDQYKVAHAQLVQAQLHTQNEVRRGALALP